MRSLKPIKQLTPEMIDSLVEDIQRDLVKKAMAARPQVRPQDWIVRQVLPWTDLGITSAGQAGATTDYWGCTTLVASTLLTYVNHRLDDNEFVALYGVNIRDVNPCVVKMLFQTGAGASTVANWNVEHLYGQEVPEGVTPEYLYYGGGSTCQIQLLPDSVGKAVGADAIADHVVLLGLIAKPAGEVVSY
jgi:hypothetical protein